MPVNGPGGLLTGLPVLTFFRPPMRAWRAMIMFYRTFHPALPRARSHQLWSRLAGLTTIALALVYACLGSGVALAQPTNNDYYKAAGTELLRNVDKYHLGLATDKLRAHAYESGFGDIGFMLNYFPNHPQALMLLIELCDQWKSYRCDAQDRFENAIAVNPDIAATYVLQGIYLFRTKRLPAAVASLENAVKLDPESLNAHYNLGLVYFETKQFDLANAEAQRAYQLGAPLPGLRDKLTRAGKWKPIDAAPPDAAIPAAPDAPAPPAPQAEYRGGRWRAARFDLHRVCAAPPINQHLRATARCWPDICFDGVVATARFPRAWPNAPGQRSVKCRRHCACFATGADQTAQEYGPTA